MNIILLCALPVLSAGLLVLAFPPFDAGFLAWVGLALLLFALRQRGAFAACGFALLFGGNYCLGVYHWGMQIASFNILDFLVMTFALSLYVVLFGLVYRLLFTPLGAWRIVAVPALWVSLEYVRANLGFLAFPWDLLGHSQYRNPLVIQMADVTGVYGISFLLLMVNQWLSELPDLCVRPWDAVIAAGRRRASNRLCTVQLPAVLAVVLLVLTYGWYRMQAPEGDRRLRVAVIQGNVLAWDKMAISEQRDHLQVYQQLSAEAATSKPDLIVWPAASLPAPMSTSRLVRFTIERLARETGCHLLVGGAGYDKLKPRKERILPYANSEFLISPAGRLGAQYNKIKLLPFNETLPLERWITWPRWITTVKDSFQAGDHYTLFQVGEAKFGTPVCWENLFPDVFRRFVGDGANLMVSVTNEGFFGHSAGPYQALAMNVFRAVENRVAVVRAASTGVSAFISARGEILERVHDSQGKDLFVAGYLVRDMPLSDHKTFYTLYGDIFVYVVACGLGLIIMVSLVRLGTPNTIHDLQPAGDRATPG